jgi:hypothetical protein
VKDELGITQNKVMVVCFKTASQNFPGEMKRNQENLSQDSRSEG